MSLKPSIVFSSTLAPLLMMALSGCQSTLEKMCKELPEFRGSLESAVLALRPYKEVGTSDGRFLASTEVPVQKKGKQPVMEMAARDRKDWINWAERKLGQSQSYLSIMYENPSLGRRIEPLGEIPTLIVTFHGHAVKGDVIKMEEVLGKLTAMAEQSQTKFCKSSP